MERRSAKRAIPRKRYTIDAFEGIEELKNAASDDDATPLPRKGDSSGEEFQVDVEAEPEEDEMSGIEVQREDASEGASDAGERDVDAVSIAEDVEPLQNIRRTGMLDFSHLSVNKSSKLHLDASPEGDKIYTRPLPDALKTRTAKETRRLQLYGPLATDYEPTQKAALRWAWEPTLPTRREDAAGLGDLHHSFAQSDEDRELAALTFRRWYLERGGQKAFNERQILTPLSEEEGQIYMPASDEGFCSFLMGPYNDQKLYRLSIGQSMLIADAFRHARSPDKDLSEILPASYKPGFIINLGGRVRCLGWLPGQTSGEQYLAVSVAQPNESGTPHASAFGPQTPGPASIQIWRFDANKDGFLSRNTPWRLSLVLCTEWGDVKALQWCHIAGGVSSESGNTRPRLLAAIWGDGAIRILDVSQPPDANGPAYVYIRKPAFESKPPSTVCTCLTWLSFTRIAAGCANGCVAVWDVAEALRAPASNARPQIYSSVCTGFILSITTCYPSHPNHLLTTSVDGYARLTDLTRPNPSSQTTTALSQRTRGCQPLLLWHDYAQAALSVDENGNFKGYPIRRFFNTVTFGRCKGTATACATSPCHPFVLAGAASGEVFAVNPIRKLTDGKPGVLQQVWFAHEWRRPTDSEAAADGDHAMTGVGGVGAASPPVECSASRNQIGSGGLSRITEGYKVERLSFSSTDNPVNMKDGVLYATTYEEASAVTALAWNPNIHVGGWAAAGMADGLLRVEDIAS